MGKIIGGSVGFMLGGPLGAIAGLALGSLYDSGTSVSRARLDSAEEAQLLYFTAAFSMLGKLAKADGVVSRAEVEVIDRFIRDQLRLDPEARKLAIRIFNRAKDSPDRFEDFATQFYRYFHHQPQIVVSMYQMLLALASADGVVHPVEERMLNSAARIFGISHNRSSQYRQAATGGTNRYYAALGCSRSDSDETIRKRYLKLANDFHPDKIVSKGLPEEFTEFAKKKFQEIQEAYAEIRKERGLC